MSLKDTIKRAELENSLKVLPGAIAELDLTREAYRLPDRYDALMVLMQEQKNAIEALLNNQSIGLELLLSLVLDKQVMVDNPHLKNLAHFAKQAKDMTTGEKDQIQHMKLGGIVLHHINGRIAQIAMDAQTAIYEFLGAEALHSSTIKSAGNPNDRVR